MNQVTVKHETFNFEPPLRFSEVRGNAVGDLADRNFIETPHWHRDLEIAYCVRGHATHVIDGKIYVESPGQLIITNCESIHYIQPDPSLRESSEIVADVIIIDRDCLDDNIPQFQDVCFENTEKKASAEIVRCIGKIQQFSERQEQETFDFLYMESLAMELLYYLCRDGAAIQKDTVSAKSMKNEDRIKAVLQYVETHYQDPLTEKKVAEKFYFSPSYFSHYFKKCTGETFLKYLRDYRLEKARDKLMNSDTPIYRIAMECGFSDDRRLIIAFKQKYGITPLQYRKNYSS